MLKRNVDISTLTLRAGSATEGGRSSGELDGQFLKVDGARRSSLDGTFERADSLLEAERDLVFSDGQAGASDRTLEPDRRQWSAGFSASLGLPAGSVATLSGSFEDQQTEALFGADPITKEVFQQITGRQDVFAGLTVASGLGRSTWTLNASYLSIDELTRTDIAFGPGLTRETNLSQENWEASALLNQRLADLAAGPMTLTASLNMSLERQAADILEGAAFNQSDTARDTFAGGLSLEVPILAPSPIPGNFGFNGNVDFQHLSDFGWLATYGYGLRWKPAQSVRLLASVTYEEGAPTLADLGAPQVLTPDIRIFDFELGKDTLTTLITGGNRQLVTDDRRVVKLGLQWNPSEEPRIGINMDYTASRIDNEVRRFALLSEDFENAFPNRVTRGLSGELQAFDIRPLQVAEGRRDEVRTALTFSKRLRTKRVRRRAEGPPTKRRRSGRPGSLRVSAIHRLTLRDEVQFNPAGEEAVLDLLNGGSIERVGGTPRHQVDLSLYRWKYGFGLAAAARYQSGTRVQGQGSDLRFSDLTTLGLRVTYEFNYSDAILARLPFLEETQIAFNVGNVLNQRQRVTGSDGRTPDNFLPELLDPIGRSVRLDVRKRF
ncbi:MAG: TonB-dependent receptor [Pseudomonadota bacterium]